MVHGA
jgi:hypothetical protein